MNIPRLIARCQHWKELAVQRRKQAEAKARLAEKWKARALDAQSKLKAANLQNTALTRLVATPPAPVVQVNIRVVCVFLFFLGTISCRAVSRILSFMRSIERFQCRKIPCYGSVVNWVCRTGLGLLQGVSSWGERRWIAIIDTSIVYCGKKALVVLRVPLDHFSHNTHAPTLSEVECIAVELSTVWDGETVAASLKKVFKVAGNPTAILKDGGCDLKKGVDILPKNDVPIFTIRDVGHVAANELKRMYAKDPWFINFLDKVNICCKRLFQTKISFLRPPKIRTKGRFQNMSRVLAWAEKIENLLNVRGRAKKNSVVDILRHALPGFSKFKVFVSRFSNDCRVVNEFMMVLKNNGLNQKTYQKSKEILNKLTKTSKLQRNLQKWLDEHMRLQCLLKMEQTPLLVSTDCIESLMGRIKHTIERNPLPEFGRLVLATPLFCGKHSQEKILACLEAVSQKQFQQWQADTLGDTTRRQKRSALCSPVLKTRVPDPPIAYAG